MLLPLALTSAWPATVVTDSDAYVDTVGPLASDSTVQRAAADRLESSAITAVEAAKGPTWTRHRHRLDQGLGECQTPLRPSDYQ